jgi:hypothetical protein
MMLMVGSIIEDIYGWKILIVLIGIEGLVGFSCNIIFIMFGLFFAYLIVEWSNPLGVLMMRKVQLVVYLVAVILYVLLLLMISHPMRMAIYSSSVYVFD